MRIKRNISRLLSVTATSGVSRLKSKFAATSVKQNGWLEPVQAGCYLGADFSKLARCLRKNESLNSGVQSSCHPNALPDLAKQPTRAQCGCLSTAHAGCHILRTLASLAKIPVKLANDIQVYWRELEIQSVIYKQSLVFTCCLPSCPGGDKSCRHCVCYTASCSEQQHVQVCPRNSGLL